MTNEGAYLFRKFGAFWGTNNTDHQARICHSTTVTGVANTWGYGAMTNSFNDIRNSKTMIIMGGNPAEAHPVSLQHMLEGAELNNAQFRRRRSAPDAHRRARHRICPAAARHRHPGALRHDVAHPPERLGGQGIHPAARLRLRRCSARKSRSGRRMRSSASAACPASSSSASPRCSPPQKPATLIWCMGQTQHTVGTANVRASCIALLLTGNVGGAGTGANIFRGHDNVQGATDVGLDIVTLPFYYGLDRRRVAALGARLGRRLRLAVVALRLPRRSWRRPASR